MDKPVVFTADIEKEQADIFDKIARDNFRSRSQHLKFIIEKEIEFHESRKNEA